MSNDFEFFQGTVTESSAPRITVRKGGHEAEAETPAPAKKTPAKMTGRLSEAQAAS